MVGNENVDVEARTPAGMLSAKVVPVTPFETLRRELNAVTTRNPSLEPSKIASLAQNARTWLFEKAFPFWWDIGFDNRAGCFHEQIARSGEPVSMPRRIRVQARQTFVYSRAGKLGWDGPWRGWLRLQLRAGERQQQRLGCGHDVWPDDVWRHPHSVLHHAPEAGCTVWQGCRAWA